MVLVTKAKEAAGPCTHEASRSLGEGLASPCLGALFPSPCCPLPVTMAMSLESEDQAVSFLHPSSPPALFLEES